MLEITTPTGYTLSTDKTAVMVKAGETAEVTVINVAEKTPAPTPTPTPDPDPDPGKLLVIKKAERTGTLLKGAVFGVYRESDDSLVIEITTDRYGEASIDLPAGEYFLRELKAPDKYALSAERISFKIKAGETKELTVVNKLLDPEEPDESGTGTLLIIKKAEGSGKRLSDAVFGVYELATNKLVMEITTDQNGEAAATLPAGEFYLLEHKAPAGYTLEKTKIPFAVKVNATVKAEVTNMLEKDAPAPTDPGTPGITIPKSGEAFPMVNYALAALLFGLAALCGFALWRV